MTVEDFYSDAWRPRHEEWMRIALEEAVTAAAADEVPVGAVLLSGSGDVLSRGHNRRERDQDPTAHAELLAIVAASQKIGSWRLTDTILYVTLEPCPMCAGAIVQARIPFVVYGARDSKAGACDTLYTITQDSRLNHRCDVLGGVLSESCARILSEFFQAKRLLGKK